MSWTRPRICPNRRVSRFSRTGRWGGGGGVHHTRRAPVGEGISQRRLFGVWDWKGGERGRAHLERPRCPALPGRWPASATACSPQRAKAGRGAPNGQAGKGPGGRARPRLRRAGSLSPQLHPIPREGWGRPGPRADEQGGGKSPPCLRSSPGLSSRRSSRLPRPGRSAPLRAFGPGSRSCDVISKASALSSDTQPSPAGPGAEALFTAAWAGRGAEKRAQAPPGETAAAAARVATPVPTPTASPRAVGMEPPPTGRRP